MKEIAIAFHLWMKENDVPDPEKASQFFGYTHEDMFDEWRKGVVIEDELYFGTREDVLDSINMITNLKAGQKFNMFFTKGDRNNCGNCKVLVIWNKKQILIEKIADDTQVAQYSLLSVIEFRHMYKNKIIRLNK